MFPRGTPETDVKAPPMMVRSPTSVMAYTTPGVVHLFSVSSKTTQSTFAVLTGTADGLARAAGATTTAASRPAAVPMTSLLRCRVRMSLLQMRVRADASSAQTGQTTGVRATVTTTTSRVSGHPSRA